MKTVNPPIRFRPKTVSISPDESRKQREEQIIDSLTSLELSILSLRELIQSPLPTTKTVMEQVRPGDEGYENAEYECGVIGGGIRFESGPTTKQ